GGGRGLVRPGRRGRPAAAGGARLRRPGPGPPGRGPPGRVHHQPDVRAAGPAAGAAADPADAGPRPGAAAHQAAGRGRAGRAGRGPLPGPPGRRAGRRPGPRRLLRADRLVLPRPAAGRGALAARRRAAALGGQAPAGGDRADPAGSARRAGGDRAGRRLVPARAGPGGRGVPRGAVGGAADHAAPDGAGGRPAYGLRGAARPQPGPVAAHVQRGRAAGGGAGQLAVRRAGRAGPGGPQGRGPPGPPAGRLGGQDGRPHHHAGHAAGHGDPGHHGLLRQPRDRGL
ncbi:MAG: hypothetical protein AVDCRST_MAG41-2801, partial [uncultured Corynebacteriales bacterium]